MKQNWITLLVLLLVGAVIAMNETRRESAPTYTYEVVKTYPHDPDAYTQGLIYLDGVLYEGTGQNGFSSLRKVDLTSGEILKYHELSREYFGEGITCFEDRLIQLTWRSNVGFTYDRSTFTFLEEFQYAYEGWGLTNNGEELIMSDGSSTIYFLDPWSYAFMSEVTVKDNGKPVSNLNELEYIKGEIFANVYGTDKIVRIDPASGEVLGWIDLSGLLPEKDIAGRRVDVLNGIAYDAEGDRLFVTGKWWPKLFEIKIKPAS